jgi:hypothetical protein
MQTPGRMAPDLPAPISLPEYSHSQTLTLTYYSRCTALQLLHNFTLTHLLTRQVPSRLSGFNAMKFVLPSLIAATGTLTVSAYNNGLAVSESTLERGTQRLIPP